MRAEQTPVRSELTPFLTMSESGAGHSNGHAVRISLVRNSSNCEGNEALMR